MSKFMFMVFILFYDANGTISVVRTVDKVNSASAYGAARWLGDPKNWGYSTSPIDSFVIPYLVSDQRWRTNRYAHLSNLQWVTWPDGMFAIPKPECLWKPQKNGASQ